MKVVKTSVFPASKEEVFCKLQKLSLLQYIAKPYATFTPVGEPISIWKAGTSSAYKLRLFGFIPFGTHKINVISFDIDDGIYTQEANEYVPVWNHRIELKETGDKQCLYSDIVEIDAGWKTLFVYLWARCFYAHRQRRWIKLLNNKAENLQRKRNGLISKFAASKKKIKNFLLSKVRFITFVVRRRNRPAGEGNSGFIWAKPIISISPPSHVASSDRMIMATSLFRVLSQRNYVDSF